MASMVRIATVKATGQRYIVQRLWLPQGAPAQVWCWGEVQSYRGLSSKHGQSRHFLRDAVDVVEVEKSPALLKALFEQHLQALEAKGNVIHRTRTRATIVDKVTPASASSVWACLRAAKLAMGGRNWQLATDFVAAAHNKGLQYANGWDDEALALASQAESAGQPALANALFNLAAAVEQAVAAYQASKGL